MNYRDIDLNLLMVLHALLEERSVSRAALRLGVSQPAVSLSLAKIRDLFGDDIFIRAGPGLVLTERAQDLQKALSGISQILQNDVLQARAFDPLSARDNFVFCTSDLGEIYFFPRLLSAMREQAPGCALECVSLPPRELAKAMERGEIDLAIGYFPDLEIKAFYSKLLFHLGLATIARKDHPTIRGRITLDQFTQVPHVVVTHESRHQEQYEKYIASEQIPRRIVARLAHLSTAPHLVSQSDAISVVPAVAVDTYGEALNLQSLALPFTLEPLEVKLYWHARASRNPRLHWLKTLADTLFSPPGPPAGAGKMPGMAIPNIRK